MSILQDLDPQYAKLHKQPSTFRKPVIWGSALLLAAACAYWFVTDRQAKKEAAEMALSRLSAAPAATSESGGADAKMDIPVAGSELSVPPSANSGATINEAGPEPRLASTVVQENARASLADAEYRRQKPGSVTPDKPLRQAAEKTGHRNGSGRSSNRNEKNQSGGNKPMQERDVDIITAIVR
jgi:hypothetical protein